MTDKELAEIRERWTGKVDSHWWCPTCRSPINSRCVTFTEQHELCGTNVVWVDGQEMSADIAALLAQIDRLKTHHIGELIPSAEGGFAAKISEVPGCITQGDTEDEAWAMLKDALKCWVEAAQEDLREQREEIERLRNPWISVEERLPEQTKGGGFPVVIIADASGCVSTAYYDTDKKQFMANVCGRSSFVKVSVTHWTYLPAAPAGGGK